MSSRFYAKSLWDGTTWLSDVVIEIDAAGLIVALDSSKPDSRTHRLSGVVVPGLVNAHSHAFQRAMAGRAEWQHAAGSFWSWRQQMYQLAQRINPEQLAAVAAQLYTEMLACGYTQVCEFHYLHNGPLGQRYANIAETSCQLLNAADRVGMGLTLLPVLYQHAGFGRSGPAPNQHRFVLAEETYVSLVDSLTNRLEQNQRLGIAFHSLRAVRADTIDQVLPSLPVGPRHIHISEQADEVDQCRQHTGQTPIAHLADSVSLDQDWSLVHATHATHDELRRMQAQGPTVALCPTTEANLGDGVFPLAEFIADRGRYAIGSDSHVSRSPFAELRLLEYGQRLQQQRRNVAGNGERSTGASLWHAAIDGGAACAGAKVGRLKPGWRADFLVLDAAAIELTEADNDTLLDILIFTSDRNLVSDVFVGGRQIIFGGRHQQQPAINNAYRAALGALYGRESR